jgi:hypothetical protein
MLHGFIILSMTLFELMLARFGQISYKMATNIANFQGGP